MSAKKSRGNPLSGYSIDDAYTVKAGMPNAGGLVDLEYGGYGIPVTANRANRAMTAPSQTKPIVARIPAGTVELLPGPRARWRVVNWVKIDDKYRRDFKRGSQ